MESMNWNTTALFLHAGVTIYMTGVIWFVQVVHYPLFNRVDSDRFTEFESNHQRLTGRVVMLPMLIELALAVLLVWFRPDLLSLAGLALLVTIWLSTVVFQIPAHRRLAQGFDDETHRRLVGTNWIRTLAWSLRTPIALAMLWNQSQSSFGVSP